MSLYLKKLLPYKAVNLLCLILADIFLCGAFCWLFADAQFGLNYYNWLKYIDIGCIVLLAFAILLGSILLTPNFLRGEPKIKKSIHIIFDVIQMFMLVILFLNLISFYENTEHILLLVSIALFMLAQMALIIGNIIVDKSLMLISGNEYSVDGINNFVKSYDKNTKQTTYLNIKDVNINNTIIKNCFIIVCVAICILGYLLIGVLATLSLKSVGWLQGSNLAWYVAFLTVLVVLVALSIILIKLKNSSVNFAYQNKWMLLSLIIVNFIIMLGIGLVMYFNAMHLSIIALLIMWCCFAVLNYVLLIEYNRQKYLYKFVISNNSA